MYKLFLLVICLSLGHFGFSQGEEIDIEGAITIANYESPSPQEGTIRWTGSDFEGFVNSKWKSLTCACDDDDNGPNCPAQQYVDGVELSTFMPMRFSYHPRSNPSQIQYSNCENSTTYDYHIQNIQQLSSNTEYSFTVQTSSAVGSSCNNMSWVDISCPILVTTSN